MAKDSKTKSLVPINVVHAAVFLFIIIMVWLAQPGTSLFSYHPTFMTLGAMGFALEGLVLMQDGRVPNKYKITVHWIGEALGLIFSYIGASAMYINKDNYGKPHYVTWHAKIGLVTLILLTAQTFGGLPAKYSVQASKLVGLKPKLIKQGHRLNGIIASVGIFLSVFLALYSDWFVGVTSERIWWTVLGAAVYPRLYFSYLKYDNYRKHKTLI